MKQKMRAINFSDEMAKAAVIGFKTQHRLPVKSDQFYQSIESVKGKYRGTYAMTNLFDGIPREFSEIVKAPYHIGDVFFARESWEDVYVHDENGSSFFAYKADDVTLPVEKRWHPARSMPLDAARLFFRVTDVRLERIRDITVEEVWHEGIDVGDVPEEDVQALVAGVRNWDTLSEDAKSGYFNSWARAHYMKCLDKAKEANRAFVTLWNNAFKPSDKKYRWDANPWVWVVEFEKISKEEAMAETYEKIVNY